MKNTVIGFLRIGASKLNSIKAFALVPVVCAQCFLLPSCHTAINLPVIEEGCRVIGDCEPAFEISIDAAGTLSGDYESAVAYARLTWDRSKAHVPQANIFFRIEKTLPTKILLEKCWENVLGRNGAAIFLCEDNKYFKFSTRTSPLIEAIALPPCDGDGYYILEICEDAGGRFTVELQYDSALELIFRNEEKNGIIQTVSSANIEESIGAARKLILSVEPEAYFAIRILTANDQNIETTINCIANVLSIVDDYWGVGISECSLQDYLDHRKWTSERKAGEHSLYGAVVGNSTPFSVNNHGASLKADTPKDRIDITFHNVAGLSHGKFARARKDAASAVGID